MEAPTSAPAASARPLAPRMLGALLGVAEDRTTSAVLAVNQAPVMVVALPDEESAVLLFERGALSADELQAALDRLLTGQGAGILHLVLCGGTAADHAILRAADERAPDRRQLGIHHLDDELKLVHLCGRRLPLLVEAAQRLARGAELTETEIASRTQRSQREHLEAVAFSRALQRRRPIATAALLGACVAIFLLSLYWSGSARTLDPSGAVLLAMGANGHDLVVEQHQLWRLLSHAFLHGGLIHILVNMVGVWSFGRFLESVLGWPRYLLLYGLSALAGGLASALLGESNAISVGASGALFGLLGAGLGLTRARQLVLPAAVASRLRPRLHGVLVLNVVVPLLLPGIDLFAHAGGGLLGFLLVVSGVLTRGLSPLSTDEATISAPEPPLVRAAAMVMALILAGSVIWALVAGQPWQAAAATLAGAL